jgi:hypothetical protein
VPTGQPCVSSASCCGGGTNQCINSVCTKCKQAGFPCVGAGECCSGTCSAGTCS